MPAATDLLREGLALHRRGAVADAAARYAEALRVEPGNADAHYYLGMLACQQGRFVEGEGRARQSLASDPCYVGAYVLLGRALAALGRHEEALKSFERAIALSPDLAGAHGHRADVLSELGRYVEAVESYDRALALAPEAVEDWFNRGAALADLRRYEEAVASFEHAIAKRPDFTDAHLRRAKALSDLGRHDDALEAIDKMLAIDANSAEAWLGRGNVLNKLKRYEEACIAFDRALSLKPNLAEATLGSGNAFTHLKRLEDAFAAYERALKMQPDFAEALLGRGNVLIRQKRLDAALDAYDRALALKPDLAEAWLGRGNAFKDLARYDDALAAYDRALAINADLGEAWLGRAHILTLRKRLGEALIAYDRAVALASGVNYAAGFRILSKLCMCDWTNLDEEVALLLAAVREGKLACPPFTILALPSSAADQLQCAVCEVRDQPPLAAFWQGETYRHDRIRLAYVSADFNEHPIGYLLAGLFERHDRSRFEVTGISIGPARRSPLRDRIEAAFEHFIDAAESGDREIAELIQRREIDIAVDLMGFTQNNRMSVFARRPAPIQVNYLGFIGTMGAEFIDYVIADKIALPFDQQRCFAEKIVHLPDCFVGTDDRMQTAPGVGSRAEAGLPPEGFVFCSFNNSYKIGRPVFERWTRLLHAVTGSVLWLARVNADMAVNLRREAEHLGVDPARLVFAPTVSLPQHLARHSLADLFLDTSPYNAGATAVAALWSGVPLVTMMGETFVGRMAASMLHALGLPELVTYNLNEYEALALKLAQAPILLSATRRKLQDNLRRTPLFDSDRFRRHIEQAYATMVDIHRNGEAPRSFTVQTV